MQSDSEIIERVLIGDSQACTDLVLRYHAKCVSFANNYLRDADLAEDATQETFVRVFRSLQKCENRDQFRSWLFKILINQCRTIATRFSRRKERFVPLETINDDVILAGSRENSLVTEVDIDLILSSLTPDYRSVMVMKHMDGLTYDEMAEITGLSVSAVKMRVNRAVSKLRHMHRKSLPNYGFGDFRHQIHLT